MKLDTITNPNYVCTVVRIEPDDLFPVPGLDNLVGYTRFGMQALTSKGTAPGLYLLFSTEVQLSETFARANNLYREASLNADQSQTGYLEPNRRVKAIKLRGNRSESLLMPLRSLSYLLPDLSKFKEGDVFDSINGVAICRKYVSKPPRQQGNQPKARVRKIDEKVFPQHADSENYFRNSDKIPAAAVVTISQKLHGTSVRYGNVPVVADLKWWEKLLRRPARLEHRFVVGSRRVVKSIDLSAEEGKAHWYADGDLWTAYADKNAISDRIPKDHVVFGELVGYTASGAEIQKGYTYDCEPGQAQLFVYRVAVVTTDGLVVDYNPVQMDKWCADRGFATVPRLLTIQHTDLDPEEWLECRYYDKWMSGACYFESDPVRLSDPKSVDEGVCIRYDGPWGVFILKAKSPTFLAYETKQLDAEVVDVEADEAELVSA